jgi:hypothetical protein
MLDNFKKLINNKDDELYTPSILVEPILKYIQTDAVVWCPFDNSKSEFVKMINKKNEVVYSHIIDGVDFFNYEPDYYDCIISNPPYSLKEKVFRRLFFLNKPFAIVMGLPILNYQNIGNMFYTYQQDGKNLQLLIVDKKVSFNGKTSSFNSSYFCYNFLPRDLMFQTLENNNSGKFYKKLGYDPGSLSKDLFST